MPAGSVGVVAVPVHPQPRVADAEAGRQGVGDVVQHRVRRLGDHGVLRGEPRLLDHPVVHPPRPLFPRGVGHEVAHQRLVAGEPAVDVDDPRRVVEPDVFGGAEIGVDGDVEATAEVVREFTGELRREQ